MQTKVFEVRDRGTLIPVLAIRLDPTCEQERYLFARAGYGVHAGDQREYVLLAKIEPSPLGMQYDPFAWGDGTLRDAHLHIRKYFDALPTGAVVDVEYLAGKTPAPKRSERETVSA